METHEARASSPMHANNFGVSLIWSAVTAASYYVAAIAASAMVVGSNLTIAAARLLGTGQNLFWTTGGAVALTVNVTVRGFDQFGQPAVETFDFAAVASGTTGFGLLTFKEVISVTVNSVGVVNAATLAIGVSSASGCRLGLPIKVNQFAMAGAANFATGELYALVDQVGAAIQIAADVAGPPPVAAFQSKYNNLKMNAAATAGPIFVIHKLTYQGPRA